MVQTSKPSTSNRFIFFGTGACFSISVLECLIKSGHIPVAIVIPEFNYQHRNLIDDVAFEQSGRPNPLMEAAKTRNIPCIFAPTSYSEQMLQDLSTKEFDFILVACWPYLLSDEVCQLASKAALNLHPSLLPKYRGANPVADQIKNTEQSLGVSLHLLDQGFDTGDKVKQTGFKLEPIHYSENNIEIRAAELGVDLFIEAIELFNYPGWKLKRQ